MIVVIVIVAVIIVVLIIVLCCVFRRKNGDDDDSVDGVRKGEDGEDVSTEQQQLVFTLMHGKKRSSEKTHKTNKRLHEITIT